MACVTSSSKVSIRKSSSSRTTSPPFSATSLTSTRRKKSTPSSGTSRPLRKSSSATSASIEAEVADELFLKGLEVPLLGVDFFRRVLVKDVAENGGDVVLDDELFLIETFEELVTQAIDGLTLLVHDVVVFKQVLAGLKVLRFDGLLRGLDALGDHARFNGHALFHAEALQQCADPLLGEDAHQVIFEREIEA